MLDTLIATRLLLGLVFVGSGLSKLLNPSRLPRVIRSYSLLPGSAIVPAAFALPIAELGLAGGLLVGWATRLVAAGAACLLLLFAAAIAVNVTRSAAIDCGCFGWEGPTQVGWLLVGRNLVLAFLAAVIAASPPDSIPTLIEESRIHVSEVIALTLCAGLILVVSAVAGIAARVVRAARALAVTLPSADT